ncbi:MAG: preprotein translocase subunit YajC [Acidobacteria bacterium]|nr:preprotein translocase subunit YajC [Acidobacteriota bacterium]
MGLALILWQAPGGGSPLTGLIPLVAIFLIFYFLLILPNQRKQKKHQQMLSSLKNGDRVITNGGIRGTIVGLKEDFILLRVPPEQVKLEVLRSAVASLEQAVEEQK